MRPALDLSGKAQDANLDSVSNSTFVNRLLIPKEQGWTVSTVAVCTIVGKQESFFQSSTL